ncbi:response regulator [Azospirillum sp. B21]|uniref:response regulator n=1 Tax=Azospirillum sp. B21 TaxID=2607496 RepID=UPI001B3BE091|nr:response regulator [Azospirillum sp. B21]
MMTDTSGQDGVLLVSGDALRIRQLAIALGGIPPRVDTVEAALDRLRGVAAAGDGVVVIDAAGSVADVAPGHAAVEALVRLDPVPAVLVLLPDGQEEVAASFIAAGAQDALPVGDAAALRRAIAAARRRQARENRLRAALAGAERAGGEAAALFDDAAAAVEAALDPILALTAAALESPLLPSQLDRLTGVRTAGNTLRATLSALRSAKPGIQAVETLTLGDLAAGAKAVAVEGGADQRFIGDAGGLRSLLVLLTAETGAELSLSLQPAGEAAELILRRRGVPRLRPLALAVAGPQVRRLGGRLLADGDAGEWLTARIPVQLPARPVAPPAALSVLLVEDNPIGRLVAAGFFKALGHAVTTAEDGAQGVAAATERRFDLIVMDVQMPVMDGHEASRAIRALPGEAGRVPIVALTAGTDAEDDAQCRAAGMDDCLHKPLTMDRLGAVLERLFPGRIPRGG